VPLPWGYVVSGKRVMKETHPRTEEGILEVGTAVVVSWCGLIQHKNKRTFILNYYGKICKGN